jgi:ribose transport system substrate-binding protein
MRRLLLLLLLAAAGPGVRADGPYQIAVIPKGTTYEFWKSLHAGALQAAQEFTAAGTPVHIIWKGSLREDDRDGQIQVVENFIGRQVSWLRSTTAPSWRRWKRRSQPAFRS